MKNDSAEIKPAQCWIKLVFRLTYTVMHGNTKLKDTEMSLNLTITGTVHEDLCTCSDCISLSSSQNEKCFGQKS